MFDRSGSVANVRPAKVALDFLFPTLSAPKEPANIFDQLLLRSWTQAPNGVGFHILVQQLVGIQLWTVAGQEVKTKPGVVFGLPQHNLRDMNGMAIENQKNLARMLFEQAPEEIEKYRGCKSSFENHENQVATIGNDRDHVASKSLAGAWNDRRLAPSTKGGSRLMIRTHPGFVAPEYRGFLSLGQSTNGRVLALEPTTYCGGILFVSPMRRLLWGQAPASQITAYGPNRKLNAKASLNQNHNRFARPKHKRQSKLIGAVIDDETNDGRRLVGFQIQKVFSSSSTRTVGLQSLDASYIVPTVGRLSGNTKNACRFGLRHTFAQGPHDSKAQSVLLSRREVSHVRRDHGNFYAIKKPMCQTFLLSLICAYQCDLAVCFKISGLRRSTLCKRRLRLKPRA